MALLDHLRRPAGQLGPITTDSIIYQLGNKLIAADPLTGDILWRRSGFSYGSEIIGNIDKLLVIPPGSKSGVLLSTANGEKLATLTLPKGTRFQSYGLNILTSERIGNQQVLKYYDLATSENKPLWKQELPWDVKFCQMKNNKIATLDSKGLFQIFNLSNGRLLIKDNVKVINKLSSFVVIPHADNYLLFMSPQRTFVNNGMNVMVNNNAVEVLIAGDVYGYSRKTGKRIWVSPIKKNAINPSQQLSTPFIVLTARKYQRILKKVGNRNRSSSTTSYIFSLLDSRTGKIVHHQESKRSTYRYTLNIDKKTKKISYVLPQETINLTPIATPVKANIPKDANKK